MIGLREAPSTVKRSLLAQLIVLYREKGVTSTRELARATGRSERRIWEAKAELRGETESVTPLRPIAAAETSSAPAASSRGDCGPPQGARARVVSNNNNYIYTPTKTLTPLRPVEPADSGGKKGLSEPAAPVSFQAGSLCLSPTETASWLPLFGDDGGALALALVEAAAYVQANSSRPLLVQVRAQLARRARDKRERDARYAAAARERQAPEEAKRSAWLEALQANREGRLGL